MGTFMDGLEYRVLAMRLMLLTSIVMCSNVHSQQPLLRVVEGSKSAALAVSFPNLPKDIIEYRSCEAVLDGNWDFGLFAIDLKSVPREESTSWKIMEGRLQYTWVYPAGIQVGFVAKPRPQSVELVYTLTNTSGHTLQRAMVHPCVVTTRAPSFLAPLHRPNRKLKSQGTQPPIYGEMYDRLWLWKNATPFSFATIGISTAESHLSVMQESEHPVEWAWWKNSSETFDEPLIAMQSRDRRFTLALTFERAIWASANASDKRACFHLFPYFGKLEHGESRRIRGKLVLVEGDPKEAYTNLLTEGEDHN